MHIWQYRIRGIGFGDQFFCAFFDCFLFFFFFGSFEFDSSLSRAIGTWRDFPRLTPLGREIGFAILFSWSKHARRWWHTPLKWDVAQEHLLLCKSLPVFTSLIAKKSRRPCFSLNYTLHFSVWSSSFVNISRLLSLLPYCLIRLTFAFCFYRTEMVSIRVKLMRSWNMAGQGRHFHFFFEFIEWSLPNIH